VENFSEHDAKNFAWNCLTVTEKLSKKTKWFHSVMTSMITFSQSQNLSIFKRI